MATGRFGGAANPESWLDDHGVQAPALVDALRPWVPPDSWSSWGSNGVLPGRFGAGFDPRPRVWAREALQLESKWQNPTLGAARGGSECFSRCGTCERFLREPFAEIECPRCKAIQRELVDTSTLTTVMLKNIPRHADFTITELMNKLTATQEDCGGQLLYDFVSLPLNFETHAPLGFAWVNARDHEQALTLWERFDGYHPKDWPRDWPREQDSDQAVVVEWGTGKEHHSQRRLIERYRDSNVMHKDVPDKFKPLLFDVVGNNAPFPKPTKPKKMVCPKEFKQG